MRTQDLSHEGHIAFMTCRHLGTTEYRYLNTCDWDCMYWHCMLLLGGGVALVGDISIGLFSPHCRTLLGTREDNAPSRS